MQSKSELTCLMSTKTVNFIILLVMVQTEAICQRYLPRTFPFSVSNIYAPFVKYDPLIAARPFQSLLTLQVFEVLPQESF